MDMIVVGVTKLPTAEQAALEAAELALATGAKLHLVSSVTDRRMRGAGGPGEQWCFSTADSAESHMADLKGRLVDGVDISSTVVLDDPAKALISEAERLEADVIVVGNKRTQGIARVLGSVANDVLKQAPCSVYVAKTT